MLPMAKAIMIRTIMAADRGIYVCFRRFRACQAYNSDRGRYHVQVSLPRDLLPCGRETGKVWASIIGEKAVVQLEAT